MVERPRSQRTRDKIMEAARGLLETRGAAHVSLTDVAEAAGVSRQALYLHYGDRAGLLVAVAEYVDVRAGLPELLAWMGAAADAVEMLDRIVELQVQLYPQIHAVAAALDLARRADEAADAAWQNRSALRLQGLRRVVDQLASEGRLAAEWTPAEAAEMLWTLSSLDVWRDLAVERGWPRESYTRHLQRVLRRVLVTGGGG